ncbi:hypothetical protein G6F45_013916 [Rhizopus arrhizus]|nr:hypothetical protein G6F45_013916 [Rhizopus arrhizus]
MFKLVRGVGSDGQPIVVEIDESKFGKRKYNKGKRVDGVWVVGGVERTPERKMFLLTVPNRNQNTLKLIIDTFVKDGSLVMLFKRSITPKHFAIQRQVPALTQ